MRNFIIKYNKIHNNIKIRNEHLISLIIIIDISLIIHKLYQQENISK